MLKDLLDWWPALGAFVAFIAGYADLKSNHNSVRKEMETFVNRYDRERYEDNRQTREMFKEIRDDIKILLQRKPLE